MRKGYDLKAHLVNGKYHIGIGHLLDAEQSHEELEVMGLEDELEDWSGFELTEDQCQRLFEIDVEDAKEDMVSFTDAEFNALNETRQAVILSMCFQLGSCRKFKSFVKHVKLGDFEDAANEMLWSNGKTKQKRSAWYTETPGRCQRASDAMRDGYFAKYEEPPALVVEGEGGDDQLRIDSQLEMIISKLDALSGMVNDIIANIDKKEKKKWM